MQEARFVDGSEPQDDAPSGLHAMAPSGASPSQPTPQPFPTPAPSPPQKKKSHKALWWVVGIIFGCVIAGGLVYGFIVYDKYLRSVAADTLLPGGSHVVLHLTIDPDAAQYKDLEINMEKIPGYHLLKKELDDTGTGKTLTQFMHDTLAESGLNYEDDIAPVLSDTAIVVIPDVSAVKEKLQEQIAQVQHSQKLALLPSERGVIMGVQTEHVETVQFEGMPTDGEDTQLPEENVAPEEQSKPTIATDTPVKFIMTAEVEDAKEAHRTLKKMQEDGGQYDMEEKKLHGFRYYQQKTKNANGQSSVVGVGDLYHALLGGQWIFSNDQQYLMDAIARKKANGLMGFMLDEEDMPSAPLSEDTAYQGLFDNLKANGKPFLVSAYVNIEKAIVMGQGNAAEMNVQLEDDLASYVNYPERYIGAFGLMIDPEGFLIKSVSQQDAILSEDITNMPYNVGMVEQIPAQLNDKFTDVFVEYDNIRDLYYSFKKNGLTQEGIDRLNEERDQMRVQIGLDFESDVIDQLEGEMALALFTRAGVAPEGALVVRVSDSARMVTSFEKMVSVLKVSYMEHLREQEAMCAGIADAAMKEMLTCDALSGQIVAIDDSGIVQTDVAHGKIYSYKIPETEISFDFGFKENNLIFGSNFATIERLLDPAVIAPLAQDESYITSFTHLDKEGYIVGTVKPFGVWNGIAYMLRETLDMGMRFSSEEMAAMSLEQRAMVDQIRVQQDDMFFLIGAFARTFDTFSGIRSIADTDNYVRVGTYIHLKDLPEGDKKRANEILDRL